MHRGGNDGFRRNERHGWNDEGSTNFHGERQSYWGFQGNFWYNRHEMANGYETFGERRDRKRVAEKLGFRFVDGDEYTVLLKKSVQKLKLEKKELDKKLSISEAEKSELEKACLKLEKNQETTETTQEDEATRFLGLAHYQIAILEKVVKAFKVSMDNIELFIMDQRPLLGKSTVESYVSERRGAVLEVCCSAAMAEWEQDDIVLPKVGSLLEEVLNMKPEVFTQFLNFTKTNWANPEKSIADLYSWEESKDQVFKNMRSSTHSVLQGSPVSSDLIVQENGSSTRNVKTNSDISLGSTLTPKNNKFLLEPNSPKHHKKSVEPRTSSNKRGSVTMEQRESSTLKGMKANSSAGYKKLEKRRRLDRVQEFDGLVTESFYEQGTSLSGSGNIHVLNVHVSDDEELLD